MADALLPDPNFNFFPLRDLKGSDSHPMAIDVRDPVDYMTEGIRYKSTVNRLYVRRGQKLKKVERQACQEIDMDDFEDKATTSVICGSTQARSIHCATSLQERCTQRRRF